jgi:hypothetical protein
MRDVCVFFLTHLIYLENNFAENFLVYFYYFIASVSVSSEYLSADIPLPSPPSVSIQRKVAFNLNKSWSVCLLPFDPAVLGTWLT